MYIPLIVLPFLVHPALAFSTALLVPILSAILTGMPPLYPPIAVAMAVELSIMCCLLSNLYMHFPNAKITTLLLPVLFLGRVINVGLLYFIAIWVDLPPKFVAGLSFVSGWPGIVLMILVIPILITQIKNTVHREVPIDDSTPEYPRENIVF